MVRRPKKIIEENEELEIEEIKSLAKPVPSGKRRRKNLFVPPANNPDKERDAPLYKGIIKVERRPPIKLINVNCEQCGKANTVTEKLYNSIKKIPESRYLCNTCSRR